MEELEDNSTVPESRFSQSAKEVISISREIAIELKHDYIGIEHLLLAITRYYNVIPSNLFQDFDISGSDLLNALSTSPEELEYNVMKGVVPGNVSDQNKNRSIYLTKALEKVLKNAYSEARLIPVSEVNLAVLLLSILRLTYSLKLITSFEEVLTRSVPSAEYEQALAAYKNIVHRGTVATKSFAVPASPISLYFDLEEFDAHDISEIIYELSALYESIGGDKLEIKGMQNLEYVRALLPA